MHFISCGFFIHFFLFHKEEKKKRNTRLKENMLKNARQRRKKEKKNNIKKKAASASSEVADLFIFDFFTTLTDKFFFLAYLLQMNTYIHYGYTWYIASVCVGSK